MRLHVIGLDVHSTPVTLREQLAFPPTILADALHTLTTAHAREAVILSTCNRVEIYTVHDDLAAPELIHSHMHSFLAEFHGITLDSFAAYTFSCHEADAVTHLFEVAAGLRSLVMGEAQIQGQVREALEVAHNAGTAGAVLDGLFRAALEVGKRARTETTMGRVEASVAQRAVVLAGQHAGDLSGKSALVIGLGKTARLAANALHDAGITELAFVSRRIEPARDLARSMGDIITAVYDFSSIGQALARADVVISCTAAPHTLVHRAHADEAMGLRRVSRPLLMIDIAVPRDIDPDVVEAGDVTLLNVDDLGLLEEAERGNNEARQTQILTQVQSIVAHEVHEFMQRMVSLAVVPTITQLRKRAEAIRKAELERASRAFADLTPHQAFILDDMTHRIVQKLLHQPTLPTERGGGARRCPNVFGGGGRTFRSPTRATGGNSHS